MPITYQNVSLKEANKNLNIFGRGLRFNNSDTELVLYAKEEEDVSGDFNVSLSGVTGVVAYDLSDAEEDGAGVATAKVTAVAAPVAGKRAVTVTGLGDGTKGMLVFYGYGKY